MGEMSRQILGALVWAIVLILVGAGFTFTASGILGLRSANPQVEDVLSIALAVALAPATAGFTFLACLVHPPEVIWNQLLGRE